MKKKITTIEELMEFIQDNWNNLSEEQYTELVSASIGLYTNKLPTVEEALSELSQFYAKYKHEPIENRPLFL